MIFVDALRDLGDGQQHQVPGQFLCFSMCLGSGGLDLNIFWTTVPMLCRYYWHIHDDNIFWCSCYCDGIMKLTHQRCGNNFKSLIFYTYCILGNFLSLSWMPQNPKYDKSKFVHLMAEFRQAKSHYLSQCWPRFMLPYRGVTGRRQGGKCLNVNIQITRNGGKCLNLYFKISKIKKNHIICLGHATYV